MHFCIHKSFTWKIHNIVKSLLKFNVEVEDTEKTLIENIRKTYIKTSKFT